MTLPSTVYAVDDDPFILSLLEKILKNANRAIETYASAEDFLRGYSPANPGCILVDMLMPGMSGLELQDVLLEQGNYTPIIFLSGAAKVRFAVEALKSGAVDYLEKPISAGQLVETVDRAIEQDMANRYERLQRSHIELKVSQLTARESEVMNWLVKGNSNKMIAQILGISSRTVEIHRRNIIAKMQAQSVLDLVNMMNELESGP